MESSAQITSIVISLLFLILIFELARRRKLRDKYALLWILTGSLLVFLAFFKEIVYFIAKSLGIKTPINALILIGVFFILLSNVYFSVEITRLNEQVKKLAQKNALARDRKEGL